MTDPAPEPTPLAASGERAISVTRVLIVVGVVFVLFTGGVAAWFWSVRSSAGGVTHGAEATAVPAPAPAVAEEPAPTTPAPLPATAAEPPAAETPFGRAGLGDIADWVFRYPGADYAGGNIVVDTDGLSAGAFVLLTDDPGSDVFSYYEEQLRAAGYSVTSQVTGEGIGGRSSGVLMGRVESSGRTFNVIISVQEGRTHINTQFQDANS